MKIIYFLLFLGFGMHISLFAQKTPVTPGYQLIDSVIGDLDKDGINELVAAYNIREGLKENDNFHRAIIIYKLSSGKWILWKKSEQALFMSQDGGMMGDPYSGMDIKNGILAIYQEGGSSWKWSQSDKYRYQDGDFYLIGYSNNYGKPCEYFEMIDFNLSTGKLIYKKEYERCENSPQEIYKRENEILFNKGLKIKLQNRYSKEIKFITPLYKKEICISMSM
ncbi:MAG: hypothetical protein Q8909_05840 [Bacteroidota bacterium]|nr:hypothetical protein [Bacteroidota bacterium]